MLTVETTALDGIKLISAPRHGDHRGFFSEVWNRRSFREAGVDLDFVQINHSRSARAGTLRGLHFQSPPHAQDKLVQVIRGRVLDVVVDIRASSPTFGRHVAVELSAENGLQLLAPAGFAHGFCTLEDDCDVLYQVTAHYSREHDLGLAFDDPELGIAWPFAADALTLSDKDRRHPRLRDLPRHFA